MDQLPQILYVAAGMILPVFYLPQILHCIRDNTELHAFSMSKSLCQLLLRLTMLPFLWRVDNSVIIGIALFDTFGRVTEFAFALRALRRQNWSWSKISQRLSPVMPVRSFLSRFKPANRPVTTPSKNCGGVSLDE